jgi:5-methylcytosine-specific restriction endonuclease McrA
MTSKGWKKRPGYGRYVKNRAAFLAANKATNEGRCQLHIEDVCTREATQVHHVLGVSVDMHDQRYWMAVCAGCNQKVGDPTKCKGPRIQPSTKW